MLNCALIVEKSGLVGNEPRRNPFQRGRPWRKPGWKPPGGAGGYRSGGRLDKSPGRSAIQLILRGGALLFTRRNQGGTAVNAVLEEIQGRLFISRKPCLRISPAAAADDFTRARADFTKSRAFDFTGTTGRRADDIRPYSEKHNRGSTPHPPQAVPLPLKGKAYNK